MRWALIGASNIAAEWMIDAIRVTGGNIIGVQSGSAAHGNDYAHRHNIPFATTDIEQLLDLQPDAVYISSVNDKHRSQVEAVARRGIHLICEKPLAMNLDDAKAMVEICRANHVRFATNHHLRWAASHQVIRAAIAAGDIGELRSARVFHAVYLPLHLQGWRIDNPAAGGGVVLDITVHNCDILAYLLDEYPQEVISMTDHKLFGEQVEDEAMSVWRYPSGLLAYTHESFATPHAGNGIEIHGSKGSIIGESVMSQQQSEGRVFLQRDGERQELNVHPHNLYEAAVADFVAAITEGREPQCNGVSGTRSLAVALAVLESAAQGKKVTVNYAGI